MRNTELFRARLHRNVITAQGSVDYLSFICNIAAEIIKLLWGS